jgi:hypothetical protein
VDCPSFSKRQQFAGKDDESPGSVVVTVMLYRRLSIYDA